MGKQRVRIRRLNWDVTYLESLASGKGFTITELPTVTIDGVKEKTLYGPRSELYGTTYGDDQEFAERWRCSCKPASGLGLKGKAFEGKICPVCGQPVIYRDDDIEITGWISLGKDKIINPLFYQLLSSAIGNKVFAEMVITRKKVDKDGNIADAKDSLFEDVVPLSPYHGIGIDEFRRRYYEIMDYFIDKRKNKADKLIKLRANARSVFTSHIPVYSTKLRQQSITSD